MDDAATRPDTIAADVKDFILREFLPGTDAEELTAETELVTSGVLDSLATIQLVSFLEERYGIEIAAHEASVGNLNTLQSVTSFVRSKL